YARSGDARAGRRGRAGDRAAPHARGRAPVRDRPAGPRSRRAPPSPTPSGRFPPAARRAPYRARPAHRPGRPPCVRARRRAAPHAAVVPRTSRPDNLTARHPAATIRRVQLVLASASPRRRELLGWLGIDFVVVSADVDERPRPGESAAQLVRRLAAAKASAGA